MYVLGACASIHGQKVQKINRNDCVLCSLKVRKVAFSASLLASGEGNTDNEDIVPLIYKNVFTNIGNHYNPNTGSLIRLLV